MKGYTLLHRKIFDNQLLESEQFSEREAFIFLVSEATHQRIVVRGQKVDRGEYSTTKVFLAKRWGWSRGKVIRFLQKLCNAGMIDQIGHEKRSLIRILNYEQYQDFGRILDRVADQTTGEIRSRNKAQLTNKTKISQSNGSKIQTYIDTECLSSSLTDCSSFKLNLGEN